MAKNLTLTDAVDENLKLVRDNDGTDTSLSLADEGNGAKITGDLDIKGDSTIAGNSNIAGTSDIIGTSTFKGTIDAGGTINAHGKITCSGAFFLAEGQQLFLDGGGDTYMTSGSADVLDIVVGDDRMARLTENGGGASNTFSIGDAVLSCEYDIKLTATKKLYFDGGTDTYIYESAADILTVTVGGDDIIVFEENHSAGNVVNMGTSAAGFTQHEPTYDATDTFVYFMRLGNKGFFTFGAGSVTDLNLYFPNLSCNCTLVIKQDGTGSRTITNWKTFDQAAGNESTVKWAGGSAPTLSTGANAVDIVSFYWDNDNHAAYGVASLNFS